MEPSTTRKKRSASSEGESLKQEGPKLKRLSRLHAHRFEAQCRICASLVELDEEDIAKQWKFCPGELHKETDKTCVLVEYACPGCQCIQTVATHVSKPTMNFLQSERKVTASFQDQLIGALDTLSSHVESLANSVDDRLCDLTFAIKYDLSEAIQNARPSSEESE